MTFSQGINDFLHKNRDAQKGGAIQGPAESEHHPLKQAQPKKTKLYDMFKLLDVNRKIDKKHVNKLVHTIQERNLLHLNPILVDVSLNVIDGQHRLEAARLLDVDIYYTHDTGIKLDDIARLNTNKKLWGQSDYINYYASMGVAAYKSFKEFSNRNADYTASVLLTICTSTILQNRKAVQEGSLNMEGLAQGETLLQQLRELAPFTTLVKNNRFVEAFCFVANHEKYEHDRMIQRIKQSSSLLTLASNKRLYIEMLQKIYNRQVHEKNVVHFITR